MRRSTIAPIATALLFTVAGAAVNAQYTPAPAGSPSGTPTNNASNNRNDGTPARQSGQMNQSGSQSGQRNNDISGRLVFMTSDKMIGTNVYNQAAESIGEIEDLVIERGSGRVTHCIVSSNSKMNLGSKTVTIPYQSFTWDEAKKQLVLPAAGMSDSASWPEFSKDRWTSKSKDDSLAHSLSSDFYRRSDTDRFDANDEQTRLRGKVKSIDRNTAPGAAEELIVTIVTDGNREERVVVGPSWYLAGNSITFFRDAPVDLYVSQRNTGGQNRMVARSVVDGENKTSLYDAEGWPMWGNDTSRSTTSGTPGSSRGLNSGSNPGSMPSKDTDPKRTTTDSGMNSRSAQMVSPLVLASELDGKTINCRAETCGKVENLVIECMTGRVAFVTIDPDDNFLGMGDTFRLVPWGVVSPGADRKLWIDGNKAMIVASPELPRDLAMLSNNNMYRNVYKSFDYPAADFNAYYGTQQTERDNRRGGQNNIGENTTNPDRNASPDRNATPGRNTSPDRNTNPR